MAVGTSVGRGVEVGTKVVGVVIGSGGRPSAQPARSENANDVANPNRRSSDVCPSNARLRVATTSLMLETGVKAVKISRPGKKDALTAAPSNRQSLAQATSALNAWIEVDLGALSANVAALRAITGAGVEIIAVVKANAYGHGVANVAPALEEAGVERFAVVSIREAVALRELGISRPILVMSHSFPGDAPAAIEHGITLTVHSREVVNALAAEAERRGATTVVQIKLDTGLHRFGVAPEEAVELHRLIAQRDSVQLEGLWTHMANADEADDSFSASQCEAFESVRRKLPDVPYAHAANSATAIRRPELRYGGVRAGLALHGVLPANTDAAGFAPTMSLKAKLARVVQVKAGEGVSYGLAWKATRASIIGLVPLGYGDGLPRLLGNRGWVLIARQLVPMVGRMCMDHFAVDLTDLAGTAAEGDEVVILGSQGDRSITADDLAAQAETISWEILSSMQARVARLYHRDGIVGAIG